MNREHGLRLAVAILLLITLFLPAGLSPGGDGPNWGFILYYGADMLAFFPHPLAILIIAGLLGAPLLVLANLLFIFWSPPRLKIVYRIYLLVLCPLTWYGTLLTHPKMRGPGFWANAIVITVAFGLEITFFVQERRSTSAPSP